MHIQWTESQNQLWFWLVRNCRYSEGLATRYLEGISTHEAGKTLTAIMA